MFAPLGFVSVFEVIELIKSSIHPLDADSLEGDLDIGEQRQVALSLVLARIDSGFFVCSQEERLFRVPSKIVAFSTNSDPLGGFVLGFWYINRNTGFIDFPRAQKISSNLLEKRSNIRALYKVLRKPENQKSGRSAQRERQRLLKITEQSLAFNTFLEQLAPFDGFSVCVKEQGLESLIESVASDVLSSTYAVQEIEVTQGGRPPKVEIVKQACEKLFPQGKGNAPWKQIQQEIEAECGITASIDTIKRAIGIRTD